LSRWYAESADLSHDWEARRTGDFALSPNQRGLPEDYPINDDASPIKVTNFNGVGGGTVLYAAHFPRLHPSDFKVRTLDGVEDDWPVDYQTLAPFFAKNDRMMEHCCTYQIEALTKNWLPNESTRFSRSRLTRLIKIWRCLIQT
jgi:choline dehydrogenase-like flavoprotein